MGGGSTLEIYYVITPAGRMLAGSLYFFEVTSTAFARSVEEMLRETTFSPAEIQQCPVGSGVYQTVNFRVN